MDGQQYVLRPAQNTTARGIAETLAAFGLHYDFSVLINSDILTVNYGVKQSKFTKPTPESRASDASDPEESNEAFDPAIRGWDDTVASL